MKEKIIYKSISLMLFFIPICLLAEEQIGQAVTPPKSDEFYTKATDFVMGKGIIEDWFTKSFLPLFNTFMEAEYGGMILVGQAIACCGTLLYLSYLAWGMLVGDKEWEIMPMLRPFATGLVLMNWVAFTEIISKPCDSLRVYAVSSFQKDQDAVNALRWKKYKMGAIFMDRLFEEQGKAEAKKNEQEEANKDMLTEVKDLVLNSADSLLAPVYELGFRLQMKTNLIIASALELVCMWILRIAVYGIIFVALMFRTFMIITGPISIGISVMPMFGSSFATWVSRFININLYGFVCFTTLKLGMLLMKFGYTAEISRYEELIDDKGNISNTELYLHLTSNNFLSYGIVPVSMVVTALGILMTPKFCDYIISTGSMSSGMTSLKGGMNSGINLAMKVLGKK